MACATCSIRSWRGSAEPPAARPGPAAGRAAAGTGGFTLGVETAGQLAFVASLLHQAYELRATWFYQRLILLGGSLLIAMLAALNFAKRAFNLELLPF